MSVLANLRAVDFLSHLLDVSCNAIASKFTGIGVNLGNCMMVCHRCDSPINVHQYQYNMIKFVSLGSKY